MSLTELRIHHLRNLSSVHLTLHPRLNIFSGTNGSGKTSLLEALYLLSTGHSFRTRETTPLVSLGETALTVYAKKESGETVGVQKLLRGVTQVKLNQQPCHRSSDLARFIPSQIFYQDLFQIIDAGPAVRRNLLDWGMFHVKHEYFHVWKDYRHVLKQRNALLKQQAKRAAFAPWDELLVQLAYQLDDLRSHYFCQWAQSFEQILSKLTELECRIEYDKGWDKRGTGKTLQQILDEQFAVDFQRQYTHSGPHQADIRFELPGVKAKGFLSRGQQKIILITLKLAQASLISKPCIYLLDDVMAELDLMHLRRLLDYVLCNTQGQIFLTAIEPTPLFAHLGEMDFFQYNLQQGQVFRT